MWTRRVCRSIRACWIASGVKYRRAFTGRRTSSGWISLLSRIEAVAAHLTNYLKSTQRYDKTIVFCVDQEHALDMRQALVNANSDLTKIHKDYVVAGGVR